MVTVFCHQDGDVIMVRVRAESKNWYTTSGGRCRKAMLGVWRHDKSEHLQRKLGVGEEADGHGGEAGDGVGLVGEGKGVGGEGKGAVRDRQTKRSASL